MNTRDTLICIVLISLTLYACASVAAVGGELRAAAAVQQELCAELEERTADNAALREKLEAGLSDEELERLARARLGLVKLTVGEVLEGKVTGIAKFGAFVALDGGKSGLVHISEVANTYVSDVNEYLKVGQTVKVKVIGISDEGRINLSIKRALEPRKPESAPRSRDAQPKREKPARTPVPPAASTSGTMDFEDRLKKFMQESDSRIADNRMYSEHRQRTRRK